MAMYWDYCFERYGVSCYETSSGFVLFKVLSDEQAVLLHDIYVRPEYRKSGVGTKLLRHVEDSAAALGYKCLKATVASNAYNATDSLRVSLASGFKIVASDTNLIYLAKQL